MGFVQIATNPRIYAPATPPAVADAQHAAIAIEHGCTWVTRDADFARFVPVGLRWVHLVLPRETRRRSRPRVD